MLEFSDCTRTGIYIYVITVTVSLLLWLFACFFNLTVYNLPAKQTHSKLDFVGTNPFQEQEVGSQFLDPGL